MPRLRFEGQQRIRTLERLGFVQPRQRGSHVVLQRVGPDKVMGCVVPLHVELATGTLRGILKRGGGAAEEFIDKLEALRRRMRVSPGFRMARTSDTNVTMKITALPLIAAIALAPTLAGQSNPALQPDSATFDPDGTAHITRVVPMPSTISPEAQQWLASLTQQKGGQQTLAERRARTDEWRKFGSGEARKYYPANVEEATTAGVRTDIITPLSMPDANRNRVLINLHGGGFNSDSGSLIEGIPIANLAKTKVVSVYYRLAPENPFPAAVDDVVAVYKELLKTYRPGSIGIFGTSAGAILTAEVAVRLKQLALPVPAALGIFSGLGDFSRIGDSRQLFTLNGLPGEMQPVDPDHLPDDQYVGKTDRRDPVLSPLFADLHGMPPSLLVTSTRDILLSDTTTFHRALLQAGVDARLVVFEALPHAFWYHFQLPETKEALELMAKFFEERVGR